MTADQVKLMRDYANKNDGTDTTMAYSIAAVFNNEISFSNKDHYIIYDDDNELIHCLEANVSTIDEASVAPYKINTGFYGNIQYMEGLYTMKNFKTAVKELFLDKGLINDDQYDQIMNWSNTIRNSMPDRKPIYFDETIAPIPKSMARISRKDGVVQTSVSHNYSSKIELEKWLKEYLEKAGDEQDFMLRDRSTVYIINMEDRDAIKSFFSQMKADAESEIDGFVNFSVYTNNGLYASAKKDSMSAAITKSLEENTKFEEHLGIVIDGLKENNRVSAGIPIRISVKNARSLAIATVIVNTEAEEQLIAFLEKVVGNYIQSLGKTEYRVSGHDIYADTNTIKRFDYNKLKAVIDDNELNLVINSNDLSVEYNYGGDNFNDVKEMIDIVTAEVDESGESVDFKISFERGVNMLVYTLNVTYNAPDQCRVGNTVYHTVADALANAPEGSTIELVRDVEIVAPLISTKNMTIDFGTYRITNNAVGDDAKWALRANSGTLTLNGTTGGVTGATGQKAGTAVASYGTANVIINGGHYVSTHDDSDPIAGNATIEINDDSHIEINGGDFVAETDYHGWYYVLNQQNKATGTFSVKGGTYHNYNPAVGDDNLKGNFVADGYISEELEENTFTVREMTDAEKEAARERAAEIAAEAKLDAYFAAIAEEGVTVEEVDNNTYNISIDQQSFDKIELIETMAGMDELNSIDVSDGTNSVTLDDPSDSEKVAAFKAAVDAMIPDDGQTATLTFSLDV